MKALDKKGLRVGLFGATGFIGSALRRHLVAEGCEVVPFSRKKRGGFRRVVEGERPDVSGLDGVINLAGESILQRWDEATKKRLRASRVDFSRRLVEALGELEEGQRPAFLLSGSAVGYYGGRGDERVDETVGSGTGFAAELCRDWEAAAGEARELGMRVAFVRTGVVLGEAGGAWPLMRRIFQWGLGGKLGDGRQWFPWVALEDEVRALSFLVEREVAGPVNLVAPGVVTNAEFTRQLAAALGRPAFFGVPSWVLRGVLGEASEEVLEGARVQPGVLEKEGFVFRRPELAGALATLVRSACGREGTRGAFF